MKRLQIYANFAVGDNLDEELLLEMVDAVIQDLFYKKDKEWMKANLDDVIQDVEARLLGMWNK